MHLFMKLVLVSHFITLTFSEKVQEPKKLMSKFFRRLAEFYDVHLLGEFWSEEQKLRQASKGQKRIHFHGWIGDVEGKLLGAKELPKVIEFAWYQHLGASAKSPVFDYTLSKANTLYNFGHETYEGCYFWKPKKTRCKKSYCSVCKVKNSYKLTPNFDLKAVNVKKCKTDREGVNREKVISPNRAA